MSNQEEKIHYRKAFDSPYLSSADVVEPVVLTIAYCTLSPDKTKKTKDEFNTAHFAEQEIRRGEKLKPMILNATNSKTLKTLTGTPYITDWKNVSVTIYVDQNVRFGKESVEGLRISPHHPEVTKKVLTPNMPKLWTNAKAAYKRDGNLNKVLEYIEISEDHQALIVQECKSEGGQNVA